MFAAYLLINTEMGSESTVLKALKKVEGVEEVHNLRGVYDIIARIKVDTMDKLKSIMKIVGGNDKVTAKLTVLIRERG